ncbi:MAG: DNA-directed RNA polymerase subunit omega [Lentisphaerae bacterium]|jgi:DNA-directed RNA polymerase omega subunit|nr:DNA-directed RNA polymerase subunit omega [Lentisphaerota bacterium]MBQ4329554.1 DNA-directed RNA polymerase subunit omega [Lentisphaeria bacterium]
MNNSYLERAKQNIPDPQILSVVAAKRAKQLALGARPMVKTADENLLDIALLEIAEGLLSYEFPDENEVAAPAENAEAAATDAE